MKKQCRRIGIGKKLVQFAVNLAGDMGYEEISVGVNLDNYPALKLYANYGFNKIVFVGEDDDGKFMKLVKEL